MWLGGDQAHLLATLRGANGRRLFDIGRHGGGDTFARLTTAPLGSFCGRRHDAKTVVMDARRVGREEWRTKGDGSEISGAGSEYLGRKDTSLSVKNTVSAFWVNDDVFVKRARLDVDLSQKSLYGYSSKYLLKFPARSRLLFST